MKKLITILYAIIFIWILGSIFTLFDFISDLTQIMHGNFESYMYVILTISNLILLIYILTRLWKFERVLNTFSSKTLFSKENGASFKSIGVAFVWYTILKFLIEFFEKVSGLDLQSKSNPYDNGYDVGFIIGELIVERIPLLIFAMFLLIISKLMNEGYKLKHENDLTI